MEDPCVTQPALRDLLDRMTKKEIVSDSSQSTSWKAREAEKLFDESMVAEIMPVLRISKSKGERRAAYFVLGCIGKNTGISQAAELP